MKLDVSLVGLKLHAASAIYLVVSGVGTQKKKPRNNGSDAVSVLALI